MVKNQFKNKIENPPSGSKASLRVLETRLFVIMLVCIYCIYFLYTLNVYTEILARADPAFNGYGYGSSFGANPELVWFLSWIWIWLSDSYRAELLYLYPSPIMTGINVPENKFYLFEPWQYHFDNSANAKSFEVSVKPDPVPTTKLNPHLHPWFHRSIISSTSVKMKHAEIIKVHRRH